MRRSHTALSVFLAAFMVVAVTARDGRTAEENQEAQVEIFFKRLAVAPVFVGHRIPSLDKALDDTLSCKISELCVTDPNIDDGAGAMMTKLIQSTLLQRFGENVVPMNDVQKAYSDMRLDDTRETPRTLSKRLGKLLSADLVVITTVWRYRDRGAIEGFPEKPASVAFALYLVEAETGRRVWREIFDETQEYALKDMAKFTDRIKMGMQWLSADQLARYGVKQSLGEFPSYVIPLVDYQPNGRPADEK